MQRKEDVITYPIRSKTDIEYSVEELGYFVGIHRQFNHLFLDSARTNDSGFNLSRRIHQRPRAEDVQHHWRTPWEVSFHVLRQLVHDWGVYPNVLAQLGLESLSWNCFWLGLLSDYLYWLASALQTQLVHDVDLVAPRNCVSSTELIPEQCPILPSRWWPELSYSNYQIMFMQDPSVIRWLNMEEM